MVRRLTNVARASLALSLLVANGIDATQVMHRPPEFDNMTTYTQPGINGVRRDLELIPRASGKVNMGYFTNWGIYSTGRNFPVQSIVASTLTHILYAFCDSDASSGAVKLTDTYADQDIHYPGDSWDEPGTNVYGSFKQLYLLKQKNRNLKTLLSVGGWTYSQSGHFGFVTSSSARANFISSAITLMEDNGFDGIDIDFEYPSNSDQGTGFANLVTELRTALNAHATKKGESNPYLVTIAVGAGPTGYTYLKVPQLNSALTFWNLMAYDYAGAGWSTVSDDQANVYGGTVSGFSTDKALTWYLGQGATASKIVLGIPLYGRSFANTNGIRQAFSGTGGGTWEEGVWDYKALPQSGAQVTEDNTNIASYSYDSSKRLLMSYDTPNIAVKKAQYANSKGLGGAMYWELSSDKVGSESIVGRVASTLGSLDKDQNHLNYPYSKYDNIRNQMGGGTPTTTGGTPTSTSSSQPPTGTGGLCSGVAAWVSTAVYTAGMQVTYNGHLWQAQWWTQGETPKTGDGLPWADKGAC